MHTPIPESLLALWPAEETARSATLVHVAHSDARLARLESSARPSPAISGQCLQDLSAAP